MFYNIFTTFASNQIRPNMALLNKSLSDREIAAVYMHIFGGVDDWQRLYLLAINGEYTGSKRLLLDYSSKWKRTPKIQELIEQLRRKKYALLEQAKQEGIEEERRRNKEGDESISTEEQPPKKPALRVDYTNPENQAYKLNEIINSAGNDAGQALDALKVIISTQRADREAAKENKTVRAYLPLGCDTCPLYQKAQNKPRKG